MSNINKKYNKFSNVTKDRVFNNLRNLNAVKVPKYTSVSNAPSGPGQLGNIIYSVDDMTFYGYDGNAWQALASSSVIATSLATTGLPVNVSDSNPPAIGNVLIATSPTTSEWGTLPASSLPPALQSIAGLATSGNEIIYTIATNTYATSPISAAGRSFVSAASQMSQQAALGLVPGVDVQAYSDVLDSLELISGTSDLLAYTSGGYYTGTPVTAYSRTLIDDPDAATARTTLGLTDMAIKSPVPTGDVLGSTDSQIITNKDLTGVSNDIRADRLGDTAGTFTVNLLTGTGSPSSGQALLADGLGNAVWGTPGGGDVSGPAFAIDNEIVRFDGATGKLIKNGGSVFIDGSGNVTGVNSLSAVTVSGTLNTASQPNITSVGTLTGLTVTPGLTSVDTATFSGLATFNAGAVVPTGQSLTLADIPTVGTDAANKTYVDGVAGSGLQPIAAVHYATAAILPNAPTYASPAQTLTSTGAPGTALVVDGVVLTVANNGNRILVKNQADDRENGVYIVTDYGAVLWTLTRASDFNQAATPISQNTFVFVENSGGATNDGSQWILDATVNTIDPLTDSVIWNQFGGSANITAGTGLSYAGNTLNVGGTAGRISVGPTTVDIDAGYVGQNTITTLGTVGTGLWNADTITVPYGGTGNTTLTSNRVLIGNGALAVDTSKAAPGGDFVGTTDSQTLTNKTLIDASTTFQDDISSGKQFRFQASAITDPATRIYTVPDANTTLVGTDAIQTLTNKTMLDSSNDVTARALFSNSGANTVSVYASANPTVGQVLTAINGTTAEWQTPSNSGSTPSRTLFVYQGAPDVSPNWSTVVAAVADAASLTPTASNQVLILLYPGTYTEVCPISIPQYVTLSGQTGAQGPVIIKPSAAASSVLTTSGDVRLFGITVDAAGIANIAINCTTVITGRTDAFTAVTAQNALSAGFHLSGTGGRYSRVVFLTNCLSQVTMPGVTMAEGIRAEQGVVVFGCNVVITGFKAGIFAGVVTDALRVVNTFTLVDIDLLQITVCQNGVRVGGGTTSTSSIEYPYLRCSGAVLGRIAVDGLTLEEKSSINVNDFKIEDDTGEFPNQRHIVIYSPALPADPNDVTTACMYARFDLVVFGGSGASTNPPSILGIDLSAIPGEHQTRFAGEVSIGLPLQGAELAVGGGDSHTVGLQVFSDDGGVFTDYTTAAKLTDVNPYASRVASTAAINLSSAPASVDGIALVNGDRVLVKNGSTVNPGTTSVDNGIYVWTAAGAAMTRATDFPAGRTFSDKTYFAAAEGVVNYGSRWKIDAYTLTSADFGAIIVGTTAYGLQAYSFSAFPTPATNNDALYIGCTIGIPFPGIKITLSAPLTVSTGTASTALAWEYWNGGAWVTLPIMSTLSGTPYTNYGMQTFAYSTTIINPGDKSYQYRFGYIPSWATTTVNGVLAYWVRARLITAANITQIPVVVQVKLHTNRTEINDDGYMEYFGVARPRRSILIGTERLFATQSITAPTSNILAAVGGAPTITATIPNSGWGGAGGNTDTAATFLWQPSAEIDTSLPLMLKAIMSKPNGNPGGNTIWNLYYAFTSNGNTIGDPTGGGGGSATLLQTGNITIAVPLGSRIQFSGEISLDITGLNPTTQNVWIQINRLASNGGDTYNSIVYVHNITVSYASWTPGGYFNP